MIDFFIKLFKAFNSSQTPWQMSLAISLGMAMGLTPFAGWQNILIIFIVLIINVHIGLFLVSSAFFAGIAYMIDPVFETLGYNILTNPSLADILTSAYNSSIMRLSYFNNTLVMGSTVFSFLLIVPMYFLLNSLVYIYRDKIAATLQKYVIFKKLGISVSANKDKFLRIWGLGLFVVLSGVVAAFIFMFLDPLTKMSLEKSISFATNKNVKISDVEVSLKEGSLTIKDLNVFENGISELNTQLIDARLDLNQLLFNRYHISNIDVKGMTFNQKTDAVVEKELKSSKSDITKSDKDSNSFKLDTSSFPKPETLLSRVNLSSDKKYEEAVKRFDGVEKKYKDAIENDFSKSEINSIKADAKEIKDSFNKIKKIKKLKPEHLTMIQNTLDDVKSLQKKLKAKKETLKRLKKEFKQDTDSIKNISKKIINGAKEDYANLSENYKFNQQGGMNMVGVIFGDDIKGYMQSALKYYELAKPYISSEEEIPAPKRGEGRWIKYKDYNSQLDLHIKKIEVDGIYDSNKFRSVVKNISSDQKLLNKPFTLQIDSDGVLSKKIDLGLTKLKSANYKVDVDAKSMDYITFYADAKINYTNTQFSSKELKTLSSFDVDVKMSDKISSPKIDVKTDLDKKLKNIFSIIIKQKLQEYKKELKTLINSKLQERLSKLGLKNKEIENISKVLDGSIKDFSSIDSQLSDQKKVLKSKIKNNTKEKAKDKAKELLKSLKF